MTVTINKDDCTACGACESVCAQKAIKVEEKAVVDAEKCVDCGACIDACAVGAIKE